VEAWCRRDEQGILSTEAREGASPRRWMYTPNGWLRKYVDHEGSRYEFEYKSWNHRVLARDPLDREIRYEYTPSEQIAAVVDPAGNRHEYRYDLRDALTEVHHSGSLVESYQHDRAGNLIAKRDARGELLVEYTYGAENLKSRRTLAGGEAHHYEYAPNGRFARVSYGGHVLGFAYAADGRRCRDERDGRGVEHRFSGGQLAETRVLGRFATRYRRLDEKTLEIEDPLGNRHAVVLEPEGTVVRRMACGAHEVVQFDSLGRVLGKHLFAAETQAPVWRRRFEYSPEGDLLRVEDSERGRTEYHHDAAHQLAGVVVPDGRGSGEYRYDVSGNLVAAPHLSGVEVAPGNKLVKANGGALTYDHRNNVASWLRQGRQLTFHRNALDQLLRIDGLDAPWSAEYDPLGRRTRKTFGAETTEYFWDTDRLAAELGPRGRLRVYVYADDFSLTPWLAIDYDSVDAEPASGELHYLVTDQRGAPVAALDADGRRVWSARLEPYGLAEVERAEGSGFELSLRLAGQICDVETGLYYNRFRYYSPELGRYIEEDPAGTGGGVNVYAYTSNPLVQFDPRGLDCEYCKSKDHKEEDCPKKKAAEEERKQKEIQDRLQKLREEGHGPQRHGGQITQDQLKDRAMHGKDPLTGTTIDGVHGGTHNYSKNATKINSDKSYVSGENKLRTSDEFKQKIADAENNGENKVIIENQKLEDIYGPRYKDHVSGQTRQGTKNNPTGTTPTDFTDGTMKGIYTKDANTGKWNLTTMYPDPP
jgi:RHS repeat-associated protein